MKNFKDLTDLIDSTAKNFETENSILLNKLIPPYIFDQGKKRDFLKKFVKMKFTGQILNHLIERQNSIIESLKSVGYKTVFSGTLTTADRLVAGLGSGNVLETSITLDHIFGIPYIPASSLKGMCRSVAFWKIAQKLNKISYDNDLRKIEEEFYKKELSNEIEVRKYQILFGAQNFEGLLFFLDAYPIANNNKEMLELDVMNVHFPDYYSKGEPPGEWQSPNPIFFLTVKKGIPFSFNIFFDEYRYKMWASNINPEESHISFTYEELKSECVNLLELALKEFGVGSKSRLGYGIFE